MRGRGLSPEFMTALKSGILSPILKAVQTDKDFILEIREDYINIYYKGGSILKLKHKKNKNEYSPTFDENYAKNNPKHTKEVRKRLAINKITTRDEAEEWANNIRFFKGIMDYDSSTSEKKKLEKSSQQMIVQENNFTKKSSTTKKWESTDYFIIDFEYQCRAFQYQGKGKSVRSRFDLVGLIWDIKDRNKPKDCRLAIIEVKYGDESLQGKSGLIDHLIKAEKFLDDKKREENFKKEMVTIFKQKRELGILNVDNPHEVTIDTIANKIDFLIIIAGHDPGENSVLMNELTKMKPEIKKANVQFATSSFAGYALFKENIKDFQEFMKLLK